MPNGFQSFAKYEMPILKDYKLQELREQTKIQEKQSQENDKVAKNNKFLGWIVGIATVMQAVIAYLDYKEAIRVNPPIAMEQSQQSANGRQKTNGKFCEFANTVELMKLM